MNAANWFEIAVEDLDRADGKLDACLERAARPGGTVLLPKTGIGPAGFVAIVKDSGGNSIGLHSAP